MPNGYSGWSCRMPMEPDQNHQSKPGDAMGDETFVTRILGPVVRIRSGELAIVLWSALFFFSLMSSYFLVRPVRDAFGLAKGADQLPWLVTATLITMLAVNPVFAAMISRFSRRVFVPLAFQIAVLCLAGFY